MDVTDCSGDLQHCSPIPVRHMEVNKGAPQTNRCRGFDISFVKGYVKV